MTVLQHWARMNRRELAVTLPDALVVWPIGATEQHGPHLATGTDILLAETASERAVAQSELSDRMVLAPSLSFGASDHHHLFGGTLSLSTMTTAAVVADVLRSIAAAGATRVAIVNGHGGNTGPAAAAAAEVAAHSDLRIGLVDYWTLVDTAAGYPPIPGHAGAFETSMIAAVDRSLIASNPPVRPHGDQVELPDRLHLHARAVWQQLDGYSDNPADYSDVDGQRWHDIITQRLSAALTDFLRSW